MLADAGECPGRGLNRAVALAEVLGPSAGIEAVRAIGNSRLLDTYYLFHAVLGEFELRLRHFEVAAAHFQKALRLASIKSERDFLAKGLKKCEEQAQK